MRPFIMVVHRVSSSLSGAEQPASVPPAGKYRAFAERNW